jgi:hypothetical protein
MHDDGPPTADRIVRMLRRIFERDDRINRLEDADQSAVTRVPSHPNTRTPASSARGDAD